MDTDTIWKSVLAELELTVSKPTFRAQIAPAQLMSIRDNVVTIGFANPMIRTMVETRYYSLIKSIFDQHLKSNTSIVFVVAPKKERLVTEDAGPLFNQHAPDLSVQTAATAKRLHIRAESTFENFCVSTTNQMAYAAATAVAKNPGSAYNPLFLYGGVGVGKTHLMHAVANALLAKKSNLKAVYCMGEEFLNEIVEAIQTKTARQFKQKYRSAQLLMVDDVQFIAGKLTAQEEFFHTFNAVHREGGQVILTSDRPPSEIARLEDRLRSRFEGGLTVDISPPDFELRMAIVQIKARALSIDLPSDAAQLIAANVTDTRGLEGFLRRLMTHNATHDEPVTVDVVAALFGGRSIVQSPVQKSQRHVAPQEVLDAVAKHFGIKPTALKGPKRDRPIARPRQLVMYLCKTELGLTLEDIGGLLGGRDHTTVMHGIDTITRELSTNDKLRNDLVGIKGSLWV